MLFDRSSLLRPCSLGAMLVLASACSGAETPTEEPPLDSPEAVEPPDPSEAGATIVHAVEPFELEGSQETVTCYSWTLDNDAPLYVQGVSFQNGGSLHHSNWFVVPEDVYEGEDGYWPCESRDYNEVSAALAGTVLFAQSTQAQQESMDFTDGVVIRIPERSKVVADVHLLNLGPDPRSTAGWMSLDILHPFFVQSVLSPILLTYTDLDIPAMGQAQFTATCDASISGLSLAYVLPHYHGAGTSMSLWFEDDEEGEVTILEHDGFSASPLGRTLDPRIGVPDTASLRFSCGYDNPHAQPLKWGIGIDEMCVFLGLSTRGDIVVGGVETGSSALVDVVDGVQQHEAPCRIATAPRGRAYDGPTVAEVRGPLILPPFADEPTPQPPQCEDTEGIFEDATPPTFADVQDRVLGPWCSFSSCHGFGAAGGLELLGDAAREALVDAPTTAEGDAVRVVPGDPDASYLYRLLSQCDPRDDAGTLVRHMPASAPTLLDPELVGLVRAWIEAGAL